MSETPPPAEPEEVSPAEPRSNGRMRRAVHRTASVSGAVIGTLVTLLTIMTFFSVKPVPLVELSLAQPDWSTVPPESTAAFIAESLGGCVLQNAEFAEEYEGMARPHGPQRLTANHGQVIYLRLRVHSDIAFGAADVRNETGCVLGLSNLLSEGSGEIWGDIDAARHFEITTAELVSDPLFPDGDGTLSLLLPNRSAEFITVTTCEGYCYELEGAVRVQQAFSSEGFVGLRMVPVDVYANSYLTSRYECRLRVLHSKLAVIAPIACALF